MSGSANDPAGWSVARLEDVFDTITDGDHQPPPQVEVGVPFLVIGDVRAGRLDFRDVRFVSEAYYQSLASHRKPVRGDLLYTVTGSLGIPALVDSDRAFCVQRHIAMLKPARLTNVRYAMHALATSDAFRQATQAATGTAQKTLGLASLRAMTIPVAPAGEQTRIVDAVESYLSRLDAAVETLQAAQRKLKAFRSSVLKSAVEGRLVPTEAALARAEKRDFESAEVLLKRILSERRRRWEEAELAKLKAAGKSPRDDQWKTKYEEPKPPHSKDLPELPEGWCWARAEQVSEFITKGTTPRSELMTPDRGDIPYIKVYNLTFDGTLDFTTNPTFVPRTVHAGGLARSRCCPGDVLMNIVGPPLGKVSIVPSTFDEWNMNQAIARYRPIELRPRYLAYVLLGGETQRWASQRAKATAGQFNLTLEIARDLPVPVAPVAEQERIIDALEQALSAEAATTLALVTNIKRGARLRQAVLKWAFEGKLANQDPNDEPAEKLLERIRAKRANTETSKRTRRARAAQ